MVDAATGLVSIAGGKLTTYRTHGRSASSTSSASDSGGQPAVPHRRGAAAGRRAPPAELPALIRSVAAALPALARRRGASVWSASTAPGASASSRASRPTRPRPSRCPDSPACRAPRSSTSLDEEMALTLEDVLERRTRSLLVRLRARALDGVETVAAIARGALGWTAARTAAEIERLPPPRGEPEELRMSEDRNGARRASSARTASSEDPSSARRAPHSTTGSWRISAIAQGRLGAGPACVVPPRRTAEVATVRPHGAAARRRRSCPYGGGSGVLGGAVPPAGAARHRHPRAWIACSSSNETALWARVQAGMMGDDYERHRHGARLHHRALSAVDRPRSTVGGWSRRAPPASSRPATATSRTCCSASRPCCRAATSCA